MNKKIQKSTFYLNQQFDFSVVLDEFKGNLWNSVPNFWRRRVNIYLNICVFSKYFGQKNLLKSQEIDPSDSGLSHKKYRTYPTSSRLKLYKISFQIWLRNLNIDLKNWRPLYWIHVGFPLKQIFMNLKMFATNFRKNAGQLGQTTKQNHQKYIANSSINISPI